MAIRGTAIFGTSMFASFFSPRGFHLAHSFESGGSVYPIQSRTAISHNRHDTG